MTTVGWSTFVAGDTRPYFTELTGVATIFIQNHFNIASMLITKHYNYKAELTQLCRL